MGPLALCLLALLPGLVTLAPGPRALAQDLGAVIAGAGAFQAIRGEVEAAARVPRQKGGSGA